MATPKTIVLKGDGLYKEALAGGVITPGHLITRNSAGSFIAHAVAGGTVLPMFATENELIGKEITVNYASGDLVVAIVPQKGAEIYALVAPSAAAIVVGDLVESKGDGTVRKITPFSQSGTTPFAVVPEGYAIGRAIEAIDNSANAVSTARIKIEIV